MIVSIYGLADPRQPQIVRYVGKANVMERRFKSHLYDAKHGGRTNAHLRRWVASLFEAGLTPSVVVLEECGSPR